jgi:hypothetical protein
VLLRRRRKIDVPEVEISARKGDSIDVAEGAFAEVAEKPDFGSWYRPIQKSPGRRGWYAGTRKRETERPREYRGK